MDSSKLHISSLTPGCVVRNGSRSHSYDHLATHRDDNHTANDCTADNDEAVGQATVRRVVEPGTDSGHYDL